MKAGLPALIGALCVSARGEGPAQYVSGNVRVQVLSDRLVRIEERGPKGFEDRPTFLVQNRDWPGPKSYRIFKATNHARLEIGGHNITVASAAQKAGDVTIKTRKGDLAFRDGYAVVGPVSFAPMTVSWLSEAVADSPRIVPPTWGATPVPPNVRLGDASQSGWDTSGSTTKDIYVFLADRPSREALVKDYLRLTGPIELPPLSAFGLIDSRYHPYRQQEALDVIDRFRTSGMPLSLFVLDTDWRKGGSTGYEVETRLFPDIARFFQDAHDRGVRVMLNDHPAPIGPTALSGEELQARWNGLTSLLEKGADAWWYDRNWIVRLQSPVSGLAPEVWGQRLFHDVTQRFRPTKRPLVMSNVDGIDNGRMQALPHPGFHRYPIFWTGDTRAEWKALQDAIANAVNSGSTSLLPFVSDDLGGHRGRPSTELYVRFVQFGALSPIMRLHCSSGETRHPWDFGNDAEDIVRRYVRLRYALMPTIYSAARRAHDDGTPVLRLCDLSGVSDEDSGFSHQYLFGDDILVAPVDKPKDGDPRPVPREVLTGRDGKPGLEAAFVSGVDTDAAPQATRRDPAVDFEWGLKPPAPGVQADGFSARWVGRIGPLREGGEYVIGTVADDGSRLYVDGRLVVATASGQDGSALTKTLALEKGKTYDIEMTVVHRKGPAKAAFVWIPPSLRRSVARKRVWIPPGTWTDLWTGVRQTGPRSLTQDVPLAETPMFVRDGAIVFLTDTDRGFENAFYRKITADVTVPAQDGTTTRTLYEDDGDSVGYKDRAYAKTVVTLTRKGRTLIVTVAPAKGGLARSLRPKDWLVRLRLPSGTTVLKGLANRRPVTWSVRSSYRRAGQVDGVTPFLATPDIPGTTATVSLPARDPAKAVRIEATLSASSRTG
ncbi:MAG: DUF5110 domain-containing protein [Armatimonadetes bacterium]|nr:DUF5110 domain-containing protein [Armatimonadota bacterium]